MFDPYAKVVYDYLGGMEDIRKAKVWMYSTLICFQIYVTPFWWYICIQNVVLQSQVRTVIHAGTSFHQDCG